MGSPLRDWPDQPKTRPDPARPVPAHPEVHPHQKSKNHLLSARIGDLLHLHSSPTSLRRPEAMAAPRRPRLLPLLLLLALSLSLAAASAFQSDELLLHDDDEFEGAGARPTPGPPAPAAAAVSSSRRRPGDSSAAAAESSAVQFALEHDLGAGFVPAGSFSARLKSSAHGSQVRAYASATAPISCRVSLLICFAWPLAAGSLIQWYVSFDSEHMLLVWIVVAAWLAADSRVRRAPITCVWWSCFFGKGGEFVGYYWLIGSWIADRI